ncbi:hypothetical protein BZA77DRAFT_323359 [Pyronema omphalodes]|nr:hypothetical protein BZA77DRAFT_323359 [Pyronema omphalodes]
MLKYEERIAFDLSLIVPSTVLIGLRLWIRQKYRDTNPQRTWILSDIFVLLALVIAGFVIGLDIHYLVNRARLEHYAEAGNVDLDYLYEEKIKLRVRFFKVQLWNQYGYVSALWAIKASFLCSYYTMSCALSKTLRRAIDWTWIALILSWVGLVLAWTFWCWPIERNWSLYSDFCSPQQQPAQAVLVYIVHIVTDIPVMSIPYFILRTLKLGRSERFAIGFMFMLGIMTAICSTFSFVLHWQFIQMADDPKSSSKSEEEKLEGIYLSACAEVWGAVFIVCLPSTRTIWRMVWGPRRRKDDDDMDLDFYEPGKGYVNRRTLFGGREPQDFHTTHAAKLDTTSSDIELVKAAYNPHIDKV